MPLPLGETPATRRTWHRLAAAFLRTLALCALVPLLALALGDLAPGDALADLRLDPSMSPEALTRLRAAWGIDDPLPARYVRWIASALRGNLGTSLQYQTAVWPLVQPRIAHTLLLAVPATLLAWGVALPLGAWSAVSRRGLVDRTVGALMLVLLATPELLLALLAVAVALATGWFPVGGMRGTDEGGGAADVIRHLVLPVGVLVLCLLPGVTRHVRSAVLEALEHPSLTGPGPAASPPAGFCGVMRSRWRAPRSRCCWASRPRRS